MATEIFMPKLSMTMKTGTILKWFKQVGDDVQVNDVLLEVETDKISIEVEAYGSGKLLKIYYDEDAVVPVNQVIGYIGAEDEAIPDTPPILGESVDTEEQVQAKEPPKEEMKVEEPEKVRATPAARRAAKETGVSLLDVTGTGPNGRIHEADVKTFAATIQESDVKATPLARKVAQAESIPLASVTGTGVQGKIRKDDVLNNIPSTPVVQTSIVTQDKQIKVEGVRKIIAQRMAQSAFTAPHVTLVSEVDMSRSIEMRTSLLPVIEKQTGFRLSYTEIIMKAVSHALVLHPSVNASLEGDYIVQHSNVNIGLAVSIPNGLIVPVVKDTQRKGLSELTSDCKNLANLSRTGKLLPDHMTGGTFTISNLGMYAIDAFTPIINQPESAILGVGRIQEKPVGVNGTIVLRPMMTLSLSFDHRVIDGAPAAEFLQTVKDILENPYRMIV
ncbi:2-oxo acid dehydrogenase subunit E2 [Fodinisporobacter ferrooxydans]|uniref:Dihydrolipoamide acetyltransferase component of pyruvate dehydrogenase complex n=1 Tax=Fodinisporobacter ferrooxydans TaxID=2901836 RepID=A0ABY4CLV2_9BACL|nr:2-oxo acid dehydrogenase subunit E2 [Alicyclobacillaceae bacterium MYW30-H2]